MGLYDGLGVAHPVVINGRTCLKEMRRQLNKSQHDKDVSECSHWLKQLAASAGKVLDLVEDQPVEHLALEALAAAASRPTLATNRAPLTARSRPISARSPTQQ